MSNLNQQKTAIRLEACGKTFPDGTCALEPTTLDIKGGETIVFLGPSGCGKTTTLRIIAGLESPDRGGQIYFDDDDVTDLPIEQRNVGMVFQSYALFPNMTVEQNIAYGLKIRKLANKDITTRVDQMLVMMDIEEFRNRTIDQLSGGQRQRVALARAIAVRPKVLLLDEPLTALDALLRERLRVDIDRLLRSLGITTVYVTHDQAEAMSLGDRIVVMDKGRAVQVGTPREIYFKPKEMFVADFIGTMNRINGIAENGEFVTNSGRMKLDTDQSGPVDLMFRPENVIIAQDTSQAFTGKVATSFFLGDRTRIIIEDIGEEKITIETSNRIQLKEGDDISITIEPESLVTL